MKLCIFTNHFYPEDFKVNDIAFELTQREIDVTVITAIPDYPKGKFFEGYSLFKRRREVVNGVNVIRLPIIPRGRGGAIRLVLNYVSYFICASIFTFFHAFKNKYDAVFSSTANSPQSILRKNFPVSFVVGSAVAKNLEGFDSTSLLICVEVPLPSIPSKTIKFLKIIISSKNVCIFSINYSIFLI